MLLKESSKLYENSIRIDYLTMTVKGLHYNKVLYVVSRLTGIPVGKFMSCDRGALKGYNRSLKFMNENYITISFHTDHPEFGVCINFSGQGCKFIDSTFLKKISHNFKRFQHKCTRIDIAVDDFDGTLIPVDNIINSCKSYVIDKNNIATYVNPRNVIFHVNNDGSSFAEDVTVGKRSSSFSMRLYDKRIEQKNFSIDYWKRLELELRQERAQYTFLQLSKSNFTLNHLYAIHLNNCFRFLESHNFDFVSKSKAKSAQWFVDFLEMVSNEQLFPKYTVTETFETYISQLFAKKLEYFRNSFGAFLSLLSYANSDKFLCNNLIDEISLSEASRVDTHKVYRHLKEYLLSLKTSNVNDYIIAC